MCVIMLEEKKEIVTIDDLKEKIFTYHKKNWDMVEKAYLYATKFHNKQTRESGEAYIMHPLNVAYILASMHADTETICAALLHDCIEDTKATYEDICEKFGEEVAELVDGVTKMTKMDFGSKDELTALNVRRIIVSIKKDARIIIIKLVDRLHNMRTLQYKSRKRQQEISLETLEIYVPMAYYIGAYNIKDELENISFAYLKPSTYQELQKQLLVIQNDNKEMLINMINEVKNHLMQEGIKCQIELRFKDPYSVYKKMITKSTIDKIHDLLCIKVIVKNVKECYLALMVIHAMYPPVSYKFKDYIVKPKTNMYRALHTTVFANNNRLVQFQIRTKEMEKLAKYGLTSYWFKNNKYAKNEMQNDLENKFQFFKSISELDSSIVDNIEFVRQVKKELFSSNVYVRTMDGEVIELPVDATPIDFAYKIHTDIGNNMIAAIVNDEVVSYDYRLQSNDRVRIVIDSKVYVPKREWLSVVVTTYAKKKIMEFIKDHERDNKNT